MLDSMDSIESIEPSQVTEKLKNGETADGSSPCKNALIVLLISGPQAGTFWVRGSFAWTAPGFRPSRVLRILTSTS